uniref:Uncharacterized protein n=1 Tax=Chaetoceros debilis TaxID=122233 RepID=A0A7S3V5I6_9STRA|mmetsp:Transcript_21251/g.32279  ORF Transcript_21251/g.32279 Transcript_21251/m.32279 type:complete len:162 (+) Transcript_21251:99-584(+)
MRSLHLLSILFLQLFAVTVFAENLRGLDNSNVHRGLEDSGDDAAVDEAVDDAAAVDDAVEDVDDEINAYYYNSTASENARDYFVNHAQDNYQTTPSEWTNEEWGFFAAAMFLFGALSSLGCLIFVLPCCCPRSTKTAYARCLAPQLEVDDSYSKKVQLIHR